MKYLIPLLAFSLLIGCDREKRNEPTSKDHPKEAASEVKPPEVISVNPNLKYVIKGDTVTITGCDKKASGHLIIPATIKGKTVTTISYAFLRCTSLTNITIPEGVTSIGAGAFQFCTSLTSITIPDTVTSIGTAAFLRCTSLTSITIGNGVTNIGDGAFGGCDSLTSVTFLGDAPKIGDSAFDKSSPTIYREADAKGWGDTLAGRPVKLVTEKP
jgi:hypothetical protein